MTTQAQASRGQPQRIVEGAAGMVQLALQRLEAEGVVELDEERKAAMVSNLPRRNDPWGQGAFRRFPVLLMNLFITLSTVDTPTRGRPAWRYHATGGRGTGEDLPYRDLAAALIGQLAQDEPDPHGSGVRAGRGWGRALAGALGRVAPLDGLLRILKRLGFDPELVSHQEAGPAVVHLRSCPFLELAETSPDVVCGVHLGLISGALGALGGRAAATELRPFGAPNGCVIHVHTRDGEERSW